MILHKERAMFLELVDVLTLENKDFPYRFFTSRENHIIYVYRGSCIISSSGSTMQISASGILFLRTKIRYTLCCSDEERCTVHVLRLCERSVPRGLDIFALSSECQMLEDFFLKKPPICILGGREKLHVTIEELIYEYRQKQMDLELVLQHLLTVFFLKASRAFAGAGAPSGVKYVSAAKDYIARNFDQPLSVPLLAKHLGISRSYLEAIFHKYGRRTIIEHIHGVRTDRAAHMLTSTKESVTDIAYASGFGSLQHFARVFKMNFGCTPKEYRKKYAVLITSDLPEKK